MPLFGKKNDKKDGEGLSQKEIDAFKSKNADLTASAAPPEPTAAEQPASEEPDAHPENSAGVPEAAARGDDIVPSDESPGDADLGQADSTDGPGGDGSAGAEDDVLSDDLMALFTAEETVDDDLKALTKDLEEVDMNDVLRLALEVSAQLAERFPRT